MFAGLRILGVAIGVFTLAACAAPEKKVFPDITFTHLPQLNLAVDEKRVVSNYVSSSDLPNVDFDMPALPEAVLRQWAADRIKPTGEGAADVVVTIEDASVVAEALDTDETLKAWFTDEQAVRYKVSLRMTAVIEDQGIRSSGQAEAEAHRSITVPEGASVNERNQTLFDLINATAKDLDRQFEANIRQHMAAWIR